MTSGEHPDATRDHEVDVFEAHARERLRVKLFGGSPRPVSIGRFALLELIGQGGTGTVFSAFDTRLDRKVALKVLRAPAKAGSTAEKLADEAKALAKLSHPNVVSVYDVGIESDRVFIAMELVPGETLRQWLSKSPRSEREIVDVIVAAGSGLAAAHAVGLVHRDFKPDNVLINADGRVRIVDFGLAKSVEATAETSFANQEEGAVTELTVTHDWSGTPAYMAPEQFEGVADPRSDQFALGATLFEALTGARPFNGRTLAELRNNLRTRPPSAFGRRVSPRVAQAVLRSLAPDPDDRFPSMKAMVAELERRPKRNMWRWVAAASVAGVLGAWAWPWVSRPSPCPDPRGQLSGIWDDNRAAQVRAAMVSSGVNEPIAVFTLVQKRLDAYAEAWRQRRHEICRATFIERRQSARIHDLRSLCLQRKRQSLRAFTDVLVEADRTVAKRSTLAVHQLPSLAQCNDVEALLAAVPPPERPDIRERVEALHNELLKARELERLGQHRAYFRVTEGVYRDAQNVEHMPLRADAAAEFATAHSATGAFERSERLYVEAIVLGLRCGHLRAAGRGWQALGWHYAAVRNDFKRAEMMVIFARAALQELPGAERLYAGAVGKQGWLYAQMGRFAEAEKLQREVLDIRIRARGENHVDVATSRYYLGALYLDVGRYSDALTMFEGTIRIFESLSMPDNPMVGSSLQQTARILLLDRRPEEALVSLERAEALLRTEGNGIDMGTLWMTRARAELASGRLEEAHRSLDRSVAIIKSSLSMTHPSYARGLCFQAQVDLRQRRLGPARRRLREAQSLVQQLPDVDPDTMGCIRLRLAAVSLASRDLAGAARHFDKARAILAKRYGESHPLLFEPLAGAASVAAAREDYPALAKLARAALSIADKQGWRGADIDQLRGLADPRRR